MGTTQRSCARAIWAAMLCVGLVACDFSPYRLGGGSGDGDAGVDTIDGGGNGSPDADLNAPDAAVQDQPDACVMIPERTSITQACDGVDNDCDGEIDEDYDLDKDPANCGSCGNTCGLPGANGLCVLGKCQYACKSQFHDLNGDIDDTGSNGCEYGPCDGDSSQTEVCNGRDDDCEGTFDIGVAGLETDPDNCGSCFKRCIAVNVVTTTCASSTCGYDACLDDKDGAGGAPDGIPDYADINPATLGCEYPCPVNPPLAFELCNGLDDNCNGIIDELPIAGLDEDCGPATPGETGACEWGKTECIESIEVCVGYKGPTGEICDGFDNNCDGNEDEGFNKLTNPDTCGDLCEPCDLDHAINGCAGGECTVIDCLPGYVDQDLDPTNGCEYPCTKTGPEVCDGLDNDCDLEFDEIDDLTPPDICNQTNACSGTEAFCGTEPGAAGATAVRWRCRYDDAGTPNTETDANGNLVLAEILCDSFDGDCNGLVDDSYPLGDACDDGGVGICKGTGALVCDPGDTSLTVCNIPEETEGQPMADFESCNNLDDNCNGTVDENVVDTMVGINSDGMPGDEYFIDAYEASRPDADLTDDGSVETLACSNEDSLPWRTLTWPDAEAACVAAGKRLCTKVEWQRGCKGDLSANTYPYVGDYDPLACNGYDYDEDYASLSVVGDCSTLVNDQESVLPSGFDYGCLPVANTCRTAEEIYDLSGNVQEWTGTPVDGATNRQVMGGSYASSETALSCDDDFLVFDDTVAIPTLGFRCCKDAP